MLEKRLTKGLAICVAFCVLGYFSACLCTASDGCCRQRTKCKRRVWKAIHAVGAIFDSLSELMHH